MSRHSHDQAVRLPLTDERGNYRMIGVSNMDHDHIVSADLLEQMKAGFESGAYKPYPIKPANMYKLADAGAAYRAMLKGTSRDRLVISPRD